MRISPAAVVLDAADLELESRFWQRLLGGTVERKAAHNIIKVEGSPILAIQLDVDHVAPVWPYGRPQQIHLDFTVDDIQTAHQRAVDAGARVLSPPDQVRPPAAAGYRVYADPAGHPFCLCWSE